MSNRVLAGILGLALVVALGASLVSGPSKEVRASTFAVDTTMATEGESCGGGCGKGGGGCGAAEGSSCGAGGAEKPAGVCPFSGKSGKATGM